MTERNKNRVTIRKSLIRILRDNYQAYKEMSDSEIIEFGLARLFTLDGIDSPAEGGSAGRTEIVRSTQPKQSLHRDFEEQPETKGDVDWDDVD